MSEGRVFRIEIEKELDWFVATSEDLPGLFLANRDLSKVYGAIPDAIMILLKEQPTMETKGETGGRCTSNEDPGHWIAIPARAWPRISFQVGDHTAYEAAHT